MDDRPAFRTLQAVRHPDDPVQEGTGIGLGRRLLFQQVPEGKIAELRTGRRIRLDIMPTDRTRDEEVERLLAVGAVEYEDHQPDGTGWVTMANPEGNLFCAERGATERV